MAGFVNVEVQTQAPQLATEALERLVALMEAQGFVGWRAQAAALETILTEALAPIAEDVAQVAAVVPPAIFRNYGTKLLGLPFNEGAAATANTTFTLTDTAGHTIPAGLQVQQGNLAFYTSTEVVVEAGKSSATVAIVAVIQGTEYNKLTGLLEPVESIDWLKEVTIIGETTGGAGQEEDSEYENRLQAALQLQAPRPITASDYATFVRDAPSTILPSGVVVGRSTSIDGYNPGTTALTGTTTETSTTLSEVSSFAGLTAGSELEGAGIPVNTTVVSVNEGAKTLVMSAKATATHSKEAVNSIGSFLNERTVTTVVTDKSGKALSAEGMEALEDFLESHREIGFVTPVVASLYTKIYCKGQIHCLPGYEATSVVASVKSALKALLSPETWGSPTHAETGSLAWLNIEQGYNLVRYNQVLEVIGSVPGVAYVIAGKTGLAIGFSAEPTGTEDLKLPGVAPLPETLESYFNITAV
jgi:hypothetical protein